MSQIADDGQARFPGWRTVGIVFLTGLFLYPCLVVFWVRLVSGVLESSRRREFASPPQWGLFRPCYWFAVCVVYTLGTLIVFAPLVFAVMGSLPL